MKFGDDRRAGALARLHLSAARAGRRAFHSVSAVLVSASIFLGLASADASAQQQAAEWFGKGRPPAAAAHVAQAQPAAAPAGTTGPSSGVLRSINVGFVRHAFGSWTAKIVDGGFDTATGRTIRWYPHDTDSSVVAALSAGRLDIGLVGSSVAAAGIARGLDLRMFFVLGAWPDSDGLVAGVNTALKAGEPKSLQGKVIAVPFGSSPHFRLLECLKRWGLSVGSMRIVNLQTSQIEAAWKQKEIDAAMVSEPLLSQLAEHGQRIALPPAGDKSGVMVFSASAEFIAQHVVFLSRFVDVIARTDAAKKNGGGGLREDGSEARSISFLTGLAPAAVVAAIGRYRTPTLEEQVSPSWLGGGAEAGLVAQLKTTLDIWRWAGRLSGPDPDLSRAVAPEPVQMAIGYQR